MNTLNVCKATEQYDVAFVSSIRTYGNLGPFRPRDRADFKGIRLFDMLLRPEQIVCGSTVRKGDPDGSLYGNWGIIMGGGDILQAFPYDAASYTRDGQVFSPYSWRIEGESIESQLHAAIENRRGHNEVDIALGKRSIAGLFFGDKKDAVDGVDLPSEKVLAMIAPLDLPTYQLRQGEFFRLHGETPETSPTPPGALAQGYIDVSEQHQEMMKSTLETTLLLPPRNAVSSGFFRGTSQFEHRTDRHTLPYDEFVASMDTHLMQTREDIRYFGSMALYAYHEAAGEVLPPRIADNLAFDNSTYRKLANRVHEDGCLTVVRQDVDHYLATGDTPEYIGKI